MNVIIGSSRSKDLGKTEPLLSNHTVEIWSLPGGRYNQMKHVDKHMILHHGGVPMPHTAKSHFYVVAGLCDVTTKTNNRKEHYTEVT